jgi:hypothetical protein
MGVIGGVIVMVERAGRSCIILAEVVDMASNGPGGAEKVITREAMAEGLHTSGVLLIGVGKGNISPLLHIIPRAVTSGDALGRRATEGDVVEMEWLATSPFSSGGESIFPGTAEEVEGEDGQVEDDLGTGLVRVTGKAACQGVEDGDVDRPHMSGCRVHISPNLEESFQAEDVVVAIQPGIREAQSGELLAHGM